jgi:hypothetical protein
MDAWVRVVEWSADTEANMIEPAQSMLADADVGG